MIRFEVAKFSWTKSCSRVVFAAAPPFVKSANLVGHRRFLTVSPLELIRFCIGMLAECYLSDDTMGRWPQSVVFSRVRLVCRCFSQRPGYVIGQNTCFEQASHDSMGLGRLQPT